MSKPEPIVESSDLQALASVHCPEPRSGLGLNYQPFLLFTNPQYPKPPKVLPKDEDGAFLAELSPVPDEVDDAELAEKSSQLALRWLAQNQSWVATLV
ncbi:resistance-nodulation-cell division superfamily [Corchorus olitorius]|uniref:Resistance-nodulation-cell division superfamily n=1 Tax=Corchorus olitorius TaxID=93759 RepID=A0A1R3FXX4_9ROSI|nr:resistance-nodulation-cell division superfamily [Corchorus olitorius]